MKKSKKALILLSTYFLLLFTVKNFNKKKSTITYNDSYEEDCILPYAYYNDRSIYIVSGEDIELIKEDNDNIYVIDNRNAENPTMAICDSYKIINRDEMKNILNIIIRYEQEYSSSWDRTLSSMEREWLVHNICYYLKFHTIRTEKVDLDNFDETKYNNLLHILLNFKEIIDKENENITGISRTRLKNN